jgi:hypothetical protein
MPSHDQSTAGSRTENTGRPPWPDQFTEAQYDRHDESRPAASISTRHGDISVLVETILDGTRTIARELESFTRRKPLSALAGAFVAGIVFTMLNRRRRS